MKISEPHLDQIVLSWFANLSYQIFQKIQITLPKEIMKNFPQVEYFEAKVEKVLEK